VTILTPGNNSTVNWPTILTAAATSGTPAASMRVMIDGQQAYAAHGDTLNTALKVFTGAHQISVQSLDASGNVTGTSSSVNVVAEPGDIPPVANITITPMPNVSPTTVLGCTAASTDPDGFFIGHKLQYSDGSNFSIPAALESFPAPGTYSATATVTDQYGATSTTTKTFSVAGGSISAVTSSTTKEEVAKQPQIPLVPSKPPQ
jgi:hypothetical protein